LIIHPGVQCRILQEVTLAAGVTSRDGSIQSDALLVSLWVSSVTSGTLSVKVYTLTDDGREVELISFPTVSAPTTSLLLKKSGVSLQRFRVEATYTGICEYEIYVRAIESAGDSSVRLLGAAQLETSAISVTTTPAVLLPASLEDRNGISVLNYSGAGTLFLSEDISKLPAQAWPVPPGGGWSLDVTAGVTIYAVSSSGSLDIRVAQSGS
jgi:hypothetical protein